MTKTIPIFLASDDNYAPFVATTIKSILNNTKNKISFFVLDSGISHRNKERITFSNREFDNFTIEYIKIDLEKQFGNFPLHHKEHTLNVFSRYLIPQLKPEFKKVVYLDVDIIVNCDIAQLYSQDLGQYSLGAIPEYTDVLNDHKKELNLSDTHKYFNAGVLLLNCESFRENHLTEILIEKTLKIKPKYQDQDIFNIHFQNNYKILNYKYNVSWYMWDYNNRKSNPKVQKALDNPAIMHYTTYKPWKDLSVIFSEYFWSYARTTSFFEIIFMNFIKSQDIKTVNVAVKNTDLENIKIFGIVPFIDIKKREDYKKIYLFKKLPLIKIKYYDRSKMICFISWKIVLCKINT